MAQVFSRSANLWFKLVVLSALLLLVSAAVFAGVIYRSPFWTRVRAPLKQPVPFSHEHHISGLGIDCRYCHASVEKSAFAGMPPTETCMTCHSQIWTNAPLLEPVRFSYISGKPIRWTRVNDLPDFVYFDHSIHVRRGIGCATCHGRVDQMPITEKAETLYMRWCLECHRDPQTYTASHAVKSRSRADSESFVNGGSLTPKLLTNDLRELHRTVADADLLQLQNCSTCHH